MKSDIQGILPALVSSCDEQDRFVEDTYAKLIHWLYREGVHGLYVCGMTGDGYKMQTDERKRAAVVSIALSKEYKGRVIVHVGTWDTRSACDLAEHAAKSGADAVASIPPAHSGHGQIVSYYRDLAKAAGIPVFVYYIPSLMNVSFTVEQMLDVLDIEGVVGLKFTDWNFFYMKRLLLSRPGTTVLTGFDEVCLLGLTYGAAGGVGTTYNLFPRAFVAIYDAFRADRQAKALEIQNRLAAWFHVAWRAEFRPAFEHYMAQKGFGPRCFRRPRVSVSAETVKRLVPELDRLEKDLYQAIG